LIYQRFFDMVFKFLVFLNQYVVQNL